MMSYRATTELLGKEAGHGFQQQRGPGAGVALLLAPWPGSMARQPCSLEDVAPSAELLRRATCGRKSTVHVRKGLYHPEAQMYFY